MESVYIETTIVSYVVGRPSKDPVLLGHQIATKRWWEEDRAKYRCYSSDEVVKEASIGERKMAKLRLKALAYTEPIITLEEDEILAEQFLRTGALPTSMRGDAMHLALAARLRLDYLLTWNCKHLANARILRRLDLEAQKAQKILPRVCTPIELLGDSADVFE
ncbi:hypothetical protein BH09SUM1_BH09SUM1_08890 [soil metagenome]